VTSVLAVDLGGTKTTVARVDETGAISQRVKVPAARTVDESVLQIAGQVDRAAAVGIIVPGIYTPSTGRAWCPNLWGPDEVPLLDRLRGRVSVPVVIDSDRAGSVLGEAWLGAARGLRDVVFVAIGTGIGVGILSEGRGVRGAHGIAGAAGWFALDPRWIGPYAATGCWEAEAAGPGIARAFGKGDAATVVEAARDGDPGASVILDRAAAYTGMGVANLVSVLNPEAIVLGGGFGLALADLRLDRIRAEVRRWAQPLAAERCRLEVSQLGEDAALLGAARFALDARPSPSNL
jgi:glucokinase